MNSLLCLALVIYHEARSEPILAQAYVAETVISRAKLEKRTICLSVYKKGSYSFNKRKPMLDLVSKAKALHVARQALQHKTHGFTFFNELRLHKRFKSQVKPVVVGKLMFY